MLTVPKTRPTQSPTVPPIIAPIFILSKVVGSIVADRVLQAQAHKLSASRVYQTQATTVTRFFYCERRVKWTQCCKPTQYLHEKTAIPLCTVYTCSGSYTYSQINEPSEIKIVKRHIGRWKDFCLLRLDMLLNTHDKHMFPTETLYRQFGSNHRWVRNWLGQRSDSFSATWIQAYDIDVN